MSKTIKEVKVKSPVEHDGGRMLFYKYYQGEVAEAQLTTKPPMNMFYLGNKEIGNFKFFNPETGKILFETGRGWFGHKNTSNNVFKSIIFTGLKDGILRRRNKIDNLAGIKEPFVAKAKEADWSGERHLEVYVPMSYIDWLGEVLYEEKTIGDYSVTTKLYTLIGEWHFENDAIKLPKSIRTDYNVDAMKEAIYEKMDKCETREELREVLEKSVRITY